MLKIFFGVAAMVVIALIAACGQSALDNAQIPPATDPDSQPPASGSPSHGSQGVGRIPHPCAAADAAREEIRRLRQALADKHPEIVSQNEFLAAAQAQCSRSFGSNLPSGNWIVEGGVRVCDGFLVRETSKEYCAAEIPDDWVPREFDGQTYYVQPLKSED